MPTNVGNLYGYSDANASPSVVYSTSDVIASNMNLYDNQGTQIPGAVTVDGSSFTFTRYYKINYPDTSSIILSSVSNPVDTTLCCVTVSYLTSSYGYGACVSVDNTSYWYDLDNSNPQCWVKANSTLHVKAFRRTYKSGITGGYKFYIATNNTVITQDTTITLNTDDYIQDAYY